MNDSTDQTASFFPRHPHDGGTGDAPDLRGRVVSGRYKALGILGEGGFGIVYEAEQEKPVRRRVALKILKPGMDSKSVLARFEAERQALAVMNHPNIARVLDGGVTEQGHPYFVMELVRGEPITQFCDKHRLTVQDRIELLRPVCEAVQHAHSKGIIHRDIKPSNILVQYENGRPTPKVIDFGVAKAIDQRLSEHTIFTERGQLIGTPEYMSPEQAEMSGLDIDTRTDVYSLGVVLYELLTGTTPFDSGSLRKAAFNEIQRIIREVNPPKPSTRLSGNGTSDDVSTKIASARSLRENELAALLRRDLDWIVLKCLEKDRDRRYTTPLALCEDLKRYLDHEPVAAGPPSAAYRLQKFVRRHRLPVALGTCVAVMLFAALVVVSVSLRESQLQRAAAESARASEAAHRLSAEESARKAAEEAARAEREAERARKEEATASAVNAFLNNLLASANPRTAGRSEFTVRQAIDLARDRLDAGELDEPAVEHRLRGTIGATYMGLGLFAESRDQFFRALALARSLYGDDSQETAIALWSLGNMTADAGDNIGAVPMLEEAHRIALDAFGEDHPTALLIGDHLGNLVGNRTGIDMERGGALVRRALDGIRSQFGEDDARTFGPMFNWAGYLAATHRVEEAAAELAELIARIERVNGERCSCAIRERSVLGSYLRLLGRFDESESVLRESIDIAVPDLGAMHTEVLRARYELSSTLWSSGKIEDSLEILDAITQDIQGTEKPDLFRSASAFAEALIHDGRLDDGERFIDLALEGRRRVLGSEHPDTLSSIDLSGWLQYQRGDFVGAEVLQREALEGRRRVLGERHHDTVTSFNNVGWALMRQGKYSEAEPFIQAAVEGRRLLFGEDHAWTANSMQGLAELSWHRGELAGAETWFRKIHEARARTLGEDHPSTIWTVWAMGRLLRDQGRVKEGAALLSAALDDRKRVLGEEHPDTLIANQDLAGVLRKLGRVSEAVQHQRDLLAVRMRVLGGEHPDTLTAMNDLGFFLRLSGRIDEAEALFRECVEASRRVRGDEHIDSITTTSNLALVLAELGRGEESLVYADTALETARRVLGEDAFMYGNILGKRGRSLQALGRYAEAEAAMLDSHRVLKNALNNERHEQVTRVAGYLAALYEEWEAADPNGGYTDRAEQWRRVLLDIESEP